MTLTERREYAADLIESAYGKGFALSIVRSIDLPNNPSDRDVVIVQIWTARGNLLTEYEGETETSALYALASSPAFANFRRSRSLNSVV